MGMAQLPRQPQGVYQKLNRALTCIVRLGTATLLIVEEPVAIAPLKPVQPAGGAAPGLGATVGHTESVFAGNPKLG